MGLLKLLGRKKDERQKVPAFGTVHFSRFLREYHGAIAAVPGIPYTLICSEIDSRQREALLAQGFRPIRGHSPTHALFATFKLSRDAGNPRCLFNLYLDLSAFELYWQTWIALYVTKGLRRSLLKITLPQLVIRCANSGEFPWCIDDASLDEYWLMDVEAYYRSGLREYHKARL